MTALGMDWRWLFVTCFCAFVFSVIELPLWLAVWRPEWLAITVFYWTLRSPASVGVIFAWWVGILLDVLEGKLLGVNGLILAMTAYLVLILQQRLRLFPIFQQSFMVFMVIGVGLMIEQLLRSVTGHSVAGFGYLLPAVSSAICWPVLSVFMEKLLRK